MFRAALVRWLPARHAAFFTPPAFRSRSVPSGQAMELVLPPFRRRAFHAGRDGRQMNAGQKIWALLTDAIVLIDRKMKLTCQLTHGRPRLLSERLVVDGKRALHGLGLFICPCYDIPSFKRY